MDVKFPRPPKDEEEDVHNNNINNNNNNNNKVINPPKNKNNNNNNNNNNTLDLPSSSVAYTPQLSSLRHLRPLQVRKSNEIFGGLIFWDDRLMGYEVNKNQCSSILPYENIFDTVSPLCILTTTIASIVDVEEYPNAISSRL